ncbi:hypothetical protein F5Y18DRAFT_430691 [Xylariaceae sp. FL1019]|nr:hypothetical protein F5Y18DRAFT_430691 [Xylariaceae sp. FL1019]
MGLIGSLNPNSVYMALFARPNPGEYHWGLVFTSDVGNSVFCHATNRAGPWSFEMKEGDSGKSMSLIVLVRVSALKNPEYLSTVRSVPAIGGVSKRTGENFRCRGWVKDVLVALEESGKISLPSDIDTLEKDAAAQGAKYLQTCESGNGATVVNDISK